MILPVSRPTRSEGQANTAGKDGLAERIRRIGRSSRRSRSHVVFGHAWGKLLVEKRLDTQHNIGPRISGISYSRETLAWIPMQKKRPNKMPDFSAIFLLRSPILRSFFDLSVYRFPLFQRSYPPSPIISQFPIFSVFFTGLPFWPLQDKPKLAFGGHVYQ